MLLQLPLSPTFGQAQDKDGLAGKDDVIGFVAPFVLFPAQLALCVLQQGMRDARTRAMWIEFDEAKTSC